jgi:crotonobetainyl-CoA:carnitine CoA-transferase CaiB-like acyl-CoA transferase
MDDVIRPGVEQWAAAMTKAQAASELAARGVAAGPVNSAADIVADAHVQSRALVVEADTPEHEVRVVGNPIAFRSSAARAESSSGTMRWPLLGGNTDEVLRARLALDDATIARLRESGVVA